MAEFVIDGIAYKSKMMDGEVQTLVLKRLLPTFTALIGCAPALAAAKSEDVSDSKDEASAEHALASKQDLLMPVARELADLKDADVQFILNACLEVTQRQVAVGGGGWAGVRQKGIVQDQTDQKFATRLTIAWHVLGENFGEMLCSFGLDLDRMGQAAPKTG